jgi:two-component system, sensor histidine kinase RpfC
VWMIPAYLYIIFGNGFRYGRAYLFACQALSVVGWAAAGFFVPYWQEHFAERVALLATLALLPLYISVLLGRLKQVQIRTEEALKECLERQAT